jgi:hypothetical protein
VAVADPRRPRRGPRVPKRIAGTTGRAAVRRGTPGAGRWSGYQARRRRLPVITPPALPAASQLGHEADRARPSLRDGTNTTSRAKDGLPS